MRILEVLHLDDLWGHFVKHSVLSFPLLSSLLSCGVDTEDDLLVLISVSQGVQALLWVVKMTVASAPGWLWNLVVEES